MGGQTCELHVRDGLSLPLPAQRSGAGRGWGEGQAKRTTPAAGLSPVARMPPSSRRNMSERLPLWPIGGIVIAGMNVLGMQARSRCRVVGEVENEKLAEAAGREVQGSGVRAAPVRAWARRCPMPCTGPIWSGSDCGERLADRSLECLGCHFDQARVLAFRGWNIRLGRVADACVDLVPRSFVGDGPRSAVRRSRRRPETDVSISCARRHGNPALKVWFLTDQPGTRSCATWSAR